MPRSLKKNNEGIESKPMVKSKFIRIVFPRSGLCPKSKSMRLRPDSIFLGHRHRTIRRQFPFECSASSESAKGLRQSKFEARRRQARLCDANAPAEPAPR